MTSDQLDAEFDRINSYIQTAPVYIETPGAAYQLDAEFDRINSYIQTAPVYIETPSTAALVVKAPACFGHSAGLAPCSPNAKLMQCCD
jgi:hypothetical protein